MMNDDTRWIMQQQADLHAKDTLTDVLADLRRSALDVAFPPPATVRVRIPLITRFLHERHLARWLRARIQAVALECIRAGKPVPWLELIDEYPQLLVSLKGQGRKELVEMTRWVQQPPGPKRGLLGFMWGR